MAFVRFACFLLIALPVTSLSIIKFHQEDKDPAQDSFVSLEKELFISNNIRGRRLGVKEVVVLESSKSFGGGTKEKISKMGFSSYNSNGESGKKKNNISRFETKKLRSGSALVYNNGDYMTHMHHPPKHN